MYRQINTDSLRVRRTQARPRRYPAPMPTSHPSDALGNVTHQIQQIVGDLARENDAAGTPRVELSRPADEKFGDYATNAALMLAPLARKSPRDIAQSVADRASALPGIERAEVAGPGFVNLVFDDGWYRSLLGMLLDSGNRFGADVVAKPEKILLEYVSPNPTGPLVVVSARHAAFGDTLARVMRFAGHAVTTECYINDFGRQVELFGKSILARAAGTEIPEGGYEGEYVADLATEMGATADDDPAELGRKGVEKSIASMQPILDQFRVSFDRMQSERALHDSGEVAAALEQVGKLGHLYQEDGATFLRSTTFGDDKDRAVVRSNGQPTYFAADIGFIENKYDRGFERIIYVLGADHHGYIARLKAAASALGHDADSCEIIIMQMVQLVEAGEQRKMSKRRGDFVEMRELLERIDVDASRYFLLQRSNDQALDLDLDLAQEQTSQNPVYYVQYAHARICSIESAAAEKGFRHSGSPSSDEIPDGIVLEDAERRLLKRLAEFPVVIRDAADKRAPHKLTHYSLDLAADFNQMYRDCRVLGEGVAPETTQFRLLLCHATRTVLAQALDLLGITAPERM